MTVPELVSLRFDEASTDGWDARGAAIRNGYVILQNGC